MSNPTLSAKDLTMQREAVEAHGARRPWYKLFAAVLSLLMCYALGIAIDAIARHEAGLRGERELPRRHVAIRQELPPIAPGDEVLPNPNRSRKDPA